MDSMFSVLLFLLDLPGFFHKSGLSLKFKTAQCRVWSFHMFVSFLQIETSRTDGLKILKNQRLGHPLLKIYGTHYLIIVA